MAAKPLTKMSIAAVIVLGLMVIGVVISATRNKAPAAPAPAAFDTVAYAVAGDGASVITYSVGPGAQFEQATDVSLPWSKVVHAPPGELPYVSAQSSVGGSISCALVVNGKTVAVHTSTGDRAVVTCSQ